MEIIWIVTAVLCTSGAIRSAFAEGWNKTVLFVVMALVSLTFAWLRHRQRKKN
jgi:membrane protein implicated in regulation of membrane protease activity